MRAAKVDANQAEIVDALERCGAKVLKLARLGDGVPDLLVTEPHSWRFTFVEVKTAKGKLNPAQADFAKDWPVRILRSVDEAIQMVRDLRG